MLTDLITSLRLVALSIVVCVVGYAAAVLVAAAAIAPQGRHGRLITVDGVVVGSEQVAQAFTRAEYVWPRPSAVNYAADATGGSNLSPANPAIRDRAQGLLEALGATPENPAPAELVTAAGSGIDPHITEEGANYQAERVARVRGVTTDAVRAVISEMALPARLGENDRLVNVLRLNIRLDERFPLGPGRQ